MREGATHPTKLDESWQFFEVLNFDVDCLMDLSSLNGRTSPILDRKPTSPSQYCLALRYWHMIMWSTVQNVSTEYFVLAVYRDIFLCICRNVIPTEQCRLWMKNKGVWIPIYNVHKSIFSEGFRGSHNASFSK